MCVCHFFSCIRFEREQVVANGCKRKRVRETTKMKMKEEKCEQMNPIANRISILRSCTIFGGNAIGTNDSNTVSIHTMHYTCLIVRLNPIIQRKRRQAKGGSDRKRERQRESLNKKAHTKCRLNHIFRIHEISGEWRSAKTCSDNDSMNAITRNEELCKSKLDEYLVHYSMLVYHCQKSVSSEKYATFHMICHLWSRSHTFGYLRDGCT